MKQEFNWAMDQVKLPPEAEERILRALEKSSPVSDGGPNTGGGWSLPWLRFWPCWWALR